MEVPSSPTVMDVAVVIVSYNSRSVIDGLLDDLPAACESLTWSAVVVDNGSTDGTAEALEVECRVRLVRGENVGYAAGLNAGMAALGPATAYLFLNPDVRLEQGSVRRMFGALKLQGVGIVAPRVVDRDGQLTWSLRREPTLSRALGLGRTRLSLFDEYVANPEAYEHARSVDWALGAVLLVSSACLREVGPWDESYFLYSEETDLCLRAKDSGWVTWYQPDARAWHIGGASGVSAVTHAMQTVNRVRLYGRRHARPAVYAYWALTILAELSWAARGNPRSRVALVALTRPSQRPTELGAGGSLIPE